MKRATDAPRMPRGYCAEPENAVGVTLWRAVGQSWRAESAHVSFVEAVRDAQWHAELLRGSYGGSD